MGREIFHHALDTGNSYTLLPVSQTKSAPTILSLFEITLPILPESMLTLPNIRLPLLHFADILFVIPASLTKCQPSHLPADGNLPG